MRTWLILGSSLLLGTSCSILPTHTTPPSPVTEAVVGTQQLPPDAPLTLKQIMADPAWIGHGPQNAVWEANSSAILFERSKTDSPLVDYYRLSPDSGKTAKVSIAEQHRYDDQKGITTRDGRYRVYSFRGNIIRKDLHDDGVTVLVKNTADNNQVLELTDDRIAYRADNDWYAIAVEGGPIEQLVDIRTTDAPQAPQVGKDYLSAEQPQLLTFIAEKQRDRSIRYQDRQQWLQQDPSQVLRPFYLPKTHQIQMSSLSPSGRYLLVVHSPEIKGRTEGDIMPNYVTEDGHIENVPVRERIADFKPVNFTFTLLDLQQHTQTDLDTSRLPGINDDPWAAVKRDNERVYGDKYQAPEFVGPRPVQTITDWYWDQSAIQWSADGQHLAIMLGAVDKKDRWLVTVNPTNAALTVQDRLHDNAWVNYKFNNFGWLNHRAEPTLYFLSERSNYSQLYVKPLDGKTRALTQGTFEVSHPTQTTDGRYIYFKANVSHPGRYDVYRVAVTSGKQEQMTSLGGMTDYQLSPDNSKLLLTHSTLTQPTELYLTQAKPGAKAHQLTDSTTARFKAIDWQVPDIVAVPSQHASQPIYAKVYYPKGYDASKAQQYPAVMFIHGAGYLQEVTFGWSDYFREFMFNNLLTQHGYVVMDMDYRASEGYGRDWRTAIYRNMGHPEVDDLADGINWLAQHAHVDSQRVGVYGGSYGGFLTYMSLFTQPDLFKAGAALRPVADWATYNEPYTSDILNYPDVDPLAYRRSSPIYFTQGLQNQLLINAPMQDDNVFFQDNVRLVQRLIEQEKTAYFETAIFPVEHHGFKQPSSWLDEYQRIYQLFEDNLKP